MKMYVVCVYENEEHRSVERVYLFTAQTAAIKFADEERKRNPHIEINFQIAHSDSGEVAHAAYFEY